MEKHQVANQPFEATIGDPVEIARSFQAEISDRAADIEQARRFPDDLARRLAATGLYQLCTPTDAGGCGRSPREYAEVTEELSKADAAAGWCTFIGITSSLAISQLGAQEVRPMFAARDTVCAGVFAPMGRAIPTEQDGVAGFRLSGHWQWGSGIQNSDWVSVGGLVTHPSGDVVRRDNGAPDHRSFVVERADVEIVDTWYVSGLQGTGSTDFKITDVFVPDRRVFVPATVAVSDDPIYTFPMFGFLGIGIAAVALGAAQAALDDVLGLVQQKVPQGGRKTLAERPSTHKEIATAHGHIQAGRSFFYQSIDNAWEAVTSGSELSIELRRDVRHSTTHAVNSAETAVDALYRLAGGSAVYKSFALQRRFRDIHVATQHMMVSDSVLELVGRLMVGLETNVSQL
jgi:alkylation response protein AidB-like acyl-CoA dehydrogenase